MKGYKDVEMIERRKKENTNTGRKRLKDHIWRSDEGKKQKNELIQRYMENRRMTINAEV